MKKCITWEEEELLFVLVQEQQGPTLMANNRTQGDKGKIPTGMNKRQQEIDQI